MSRGCLTTCLAAWLCCLAPAAAAERRLAIVVGDDRGVAGDPPLRFAQQDAKRVAQVLGELAGVSRADLQLLLGAGADAVRRAFDLADATAAANTGPTTLIFFYTGHADEQALHLSGTRLPWAELRQRLEGSKATLRIAFIDACHAGTLSVAKGFTLAAPAPAPRPQVPRGTAMLMATESIQVAQESLSLGGSFFTHFFLAGLRGAADANGDRRITLAELQSFTTSQTSALTSAWAPVAQHPVYLLELSGHDEVVLTDLREGQVQLELSKELEGRLVLIERSSSLITAELEKTQGRTATLAVPAGRYLAYLRSEQSVRVADVTVPWGGTLKLSLPDFRQKSFQEVAQKGALLEVRRNRVRLEVGAASAPVAGMGGVPHARVGYGYKLSAYELGTRLTFARKSFEAVDTRVTTLIGAGRLFGAWELNRGVLDLQLGLFVEAQRWQQEVARRGSLAAWVPASGGFFSARFPLLDRWFFEVGAESAVVLPVVEGRGAEPRPTVGGFAGTGLVF